MKKFVMIALLPSNAVKAFKQDVVSICPEALFYNALTENIRCRQEAVAVDLPEDPDRQLEVYRRLASASYPLEFPQVLPVKKGEKDRVCTFSISVDPCVACDNLLSMWEYCNKAWARLSPKAQKSLNFAIYADKTADTVNFQACYSAEDDFQAWQQAVADFCISFMADYSGRLSVAFDSCKLYRAGR